MYCLWGARKSDFLYDLKFSMSSCCSARGWGLRFEGDIEFLCAAALLFFANSAIGLLLFSAVLTRVLC